MAAQSPPLDSLQFNFPIPRPRSHRSKIVAKWFGLIFPSPRKLNCNYINRNELEILLPCNREILLLTGPSGAGKSSLLRTLRLRKRSIDWIDLNAMRFPDRPLVDCFGNLPLQEVLEILARVGLAEAWTYLRTPTELSDGQRWRLKLALALSQAKNHRNPIIIADEFAALLDRVTAAVVARSLRRAISANQNLRAVLATSHDDLFDALSPDLHVRCDFGQMKIRRFNAATVSPKQSTPGSQI